MATVTPLQGKLPEKAPALDKITSLESVFTVGPSEWWRVNPDTLVRQHGLKIYARMRHDDQVKAASQFKRDAIISRGWTFAFDDSSKLAPDEQKKRIKRFEDIIEAYPGSFADAINGVAAGRDFGFSLTEKVFSAVELPDGTATGINTLRFRDPQTFEFITDGYGTLTEFRQRAGGMLTTLDLKDFIHYVHAPEIDPYFGCSDLRAAYKYWYLKGRTQDFWAQFLERLAGGFPVLRAIDSTAPKPNTSDYNVMMGILANLRGAAGMLVPQGMEFKYEQVTSNDSFERAITFFDLGIARSLLVPNLLGASHTGHSGGGTAGSGAGSQSQTQLEAFYWTLMQDQLRLEATLNEQLFKQLALANFSDGLGPCFRFKPLSEERLKWLVATWATLITGGAVVSTEEDEAFLRKLLDMPERDVTATPLVTPQMQLQQDQLTSDNNNAKAVLDAKASAADSATTKTLNAALEKIEQLEIRFTTLADSRAVTVNVPPPEATTRNNVPQGGASSEGHVHVIGKPRGVSMTAFTRAVQRVNFAVIEQKQMAAVANTVHDAAQSVAEAVGRLLSDTRIEKVLAAPEKIPTVKMAGDEIGSIKTVIKSGLVNSYIDGVATSRNEIDRGGFKSGAQMARATFASIKNVAADYLDANGFRIAGNLSDASRAIMQQELLSGVKAGSSATDVRKSVWNRLVAKGMTSAEAALGVETDNAVLAALNELWVDTEKEAAAYLNTLVRTNMFDAFNEGRYAEFTDPELGDFVAALEYSAILDDRTTDICTALDGSIWDSDNSLWDTYRPPNHYNCRSILVAITQVDVQNGEWDGVESPLPDVQPADGFGPGEKG